MRTDPPARVPFAKDPRQLVRDERWFNAGPPPALVAADPVTPVRLFFTRNHAAVPTISADSYRLRLTGLVERELEYSLADLERTFLTRRVSATLACAGLRRDELQRVEPIPGELPWSLEAVSNGVWTGVALRDLLFAAGVDGRAKHVVFTGLDAPERRGETFGFGGSIPLSKALGAEVLLAFELNGEPLPPVHGYPLRVVVPGYIGARSVKWLSEIRLQQGPSENYFHAQAYRLYPRHLRLDSVRPEDGVALGDVPLNSVILTPEDSAHVPPGPVEVRGWALANGGRAIGRVELSADGGRSWQRAELPAVRDPWSWCFWRTEVRLPAGRHTLTVRAWDSAGEGQPSDVAELWNCKGYANNAWHRVEIAVSA